MANKKITELTALTDPDANDLLAIVDDPSGSPVTKRITATKLVKSLNNQSATFVVAASDSLHKERADYVCDGVSDQVEIQAAIAALPTQGGLIHFSSGKYYISDTINVNRGHTIFEGEGARGRGTTFYLIDGANCDMIDVPTAKFKMKYMELDGNKDGQTVDDIRGVYEHAGLSSDPTFINVYTWLVKGYSFWIEGSHGLFDGVVPEWSGGGIYINGGRQTRIVNSLIYKNTVNLKITGRVATDGGRTVVGNCNFIGFSGIELTDTEANVISGCSFSDHGAYAIYLNNADDNIVSDCQITDVDAHGVYLVNGSSHNLISSVHLKDIGNVGDNIYTALFVKNDGDPCLHNTIQNCLVRSTAANKHRFCIAFDSSQDYNRAIGNDLRDYTDKGIFVMGSNLVIKDNIGYTTKNSGSSTGTGAQQPMAHGLAATPTKVILWNIEDGANPYQSAAAGETNIYVLAVINQDWGWEAEVV